MACVPSVLRVFWTLLAWVPSFSLKATTKHLVSVYVAFKYRECHCHLYRTTRLVFTQGYSFGILSLLRVFVFAVRNFRPTIWTSFSINLIKSDNLTPCGIMISSLTKSDASGTVAHKTQKTFKTQTNFPKHILICRNTHQITMTQTKFPKSKIHSSQVPASVNVHEVP